MQASEPHAGCKYTASLRVWLLALESSFLRVFLLNGNGKELINNDNKHKHHDRNIQASEFPPLFCHGSERPSPNIAYQTEATEMV